MAIEVGGPSGQHDMMPAVIVPGAGRDWSGIILNIGILALALAIATVACTSFQPVTMVVPGTIDVADEIRITKLDGTEIRLTDPRIVDDTLFGRPLDEFGGWSKDTVSIPVDGVAEILTSQPDRTKTTGFAILVGVLSAAAVVVFLSLLNILLEYS